MVGQPQNPAPVPMANMVPIGQGPPGAPIGQPGAPIGQPGAQFGQPQPIPLNTVVGQPQYNNTAQYDQQYQAPPQQNSEPAPAVADIQRPASGGYDDDVKQMDADDGLKSEENVGCCKKYCCKNVTYEEFESKKKKRLYMAIITCILSIVFLALAISSYTDIKDFVVDYQEVIDTWETQPIVNVTVGGALGCPGGYTRAGYTWQGVHPACECPPSANTSTTPRKACNGAAISQGCKDREAVPSVTIDMFPGSPICFKRGGDTALQRGDDPSGGSGCASGYHQCGTGNLAVCFPDGDGCPVTDISILYGVQGGTGADEITAIGSTGYYLYVKRQGGMTISLADRNSSYSLDPDRKPITTLDVYNTRDCYINGCGLSSLESEYTTQEDNMKEDYPTFGWKLKNRCDSGCDKGVDTRYLSVMTRSMTSILSNYTFNNNTGSPEGIPDVFYYFTNSPVFSLQYRSEINWDVQCPENRQSVKDRESDVLTVRDLQMVLLVVSIITLISLAIIYPCVDWFKTRTAYRCRKQRCCSKLFLKIGALTITAVVIIIAISMLTFWGDIDDNNCSDSLTQNTFGELNDLFGKLSKKDIGAGVSNAGDFINGILENMWFY